MPWMSVLESLLLFEGRDALAPVAVRLRIDLGRDAVGLGTRRVVNCSKAVIEPNGGMNHGILTCDS